MFFPSLRFDESTMSTNSKENLLSTTLDDLDLASNPDLEIGETNPARKAGCLTRLRHTTFRSAIFILIFTGAVMLLHQAWTRIHSTKLAFLQLWRNSRRSNFCTDANMTRWQRHGSLTGVETTSSSLSLRLLVPTQTEAGTVCHVFSFLPCQPHRNRH